MPARCSFYINNDDIDAASDLQQGDIISKIPFSSFNLSDAEVVRDQNLLRNVDLSIAGDEHRDGSLLVSPFRLYPAVIVSQSCDMARGVRPITLAVIRPFSEIFPDMKLESRSFRSKIKDLSNAGKTPILFPLPPSGGNILDNRYCLVDLLLLTTLDAVNYSAVQRLRIGRLAPEPSLLLQERISRSFGRLAATDGIYFGDADFELEFPNPRPL